MLPYSTFNSHLTPHWADSAHWTGRR